MMDTSNPTSYSNLYQKTNMRRCTQCFCLLGWGYWTRTNVCRNQNPVPCQLGETPLFTRHIILLHYPLCDSRNWMARKMGLEPITYSLMHLLYMPLLTYINIISYFFIKIKYHLYVFHHKNFLFHSKDKLKFFP